MRECDPKDAQLALIRYAYEHHDVSRALLASPSVRIVQRVRELCRTLNGQEWERHNPGSAEAAMAFFAYASAGALAIVSHWLEAGCPVPPETINDFLWRMALYGASGFSKDEV